MTIEGDLRVTLGFDGRRVHDVAIRATRPHAIGPLLRGQEAAAAVGMVSRLYAVCAAAQGVAAANACAAARDGGVADDEIRRREVLVAVEAVQEHCSRLGLGWATVMDDAPLLSFVRGVRRLTLPLVDAGVRSLVRSEGAGTGNDRGVAADAAMRNVGDQVGSQLLGQSCGAWLAQPSVNELEAWADSGAVPPARWLRVLLDEFASLGGSAIAPMPRTHRSALGASVIPGWRTSRSFVEQPEWDEEPVETGPLARMQDHPLIGAALGAWGNSVATRLVARLTELAMLVQALQGDGDPGGVDAFQVDGEGYASAHTARGLLLHRASLSGGRIADYAIVAPTDWNFRAHGAFACGLTDLAAADDAAVMRSARVLAQAVDPCVTCTIEVVHA